ncbi:DUF4097 family beta strand repeat-containing protein [Gemmatimonas sp.]
MTFGVRWSLLLAASALLWSVAGSHLQAGLAPVALPPAAADSGPPVSRGWRVTTDASLRLYLPSGTLRVVTWDRDSVHVGGTLGANASLFGGGAASHVKLGVEADNMRDGTLPTASLEVRVPRRARVWVKMIDGELSVTGTRAELEAYTIRGRVTVHDVAGSTTIESIDAPVTLSNATGDVRIRGSRAVVSLDQVNALVSISTVSGSVVTRRSPIEGRIETVGGGITVRGVKAGARLGLQSHAGAVLLELPAGRVPLLELASYRGVVRPAGSTMGREEFGRIDARSFRGNITVSLVP